MSVNCVRVKVYAADRKALRRLVRERDYVRMSTRDPHETPDAFRAVA